MYTSDELKALLKSRTGGTDQNLTGYETSPPAATTDIIANESITTIPGPQGQTQQIQPGQKLSGYIPVRPGVPQWGMPAATTNWEAAQYSTTQMQFNSPLAISVAKKYDLDSAAPPAIYPKGVPNAQKEGQTRGRDEQNAEVNQGTSQQSGGEGIQEVPEKQKVGPSQQAPYMGPHSQNAWQWQ